MPMAASSSVRPSSSQRSRAIGTLPLTQIVVVQLAQVEAGRRGCGRRRRAARRAASCRSGRSAPGRGSRRRTRPPRRRWRCPSGRGPASSAAADSMVRAPVARPTSTVTRRARSRMKLQHRGLGVRRVVEQAGGQHQLLVVEGDALVGAGVVVVPAQRAGVSPGQRELLVVDALVDDPGPRVAGVGGVEVGQVRAGLRHVGDAVLGQPPGPVSSSATPRKRSGSR